MLLGKNSLWNKLVQSLMKPYVLHNPKKDTLIFGYGIKHMFGWKIPENGCAAPWCAYGITKGIKKVVFDPSFKKFQPHSTSGWFSGFLRLTTIEGIENIDFSLVTDTSFMFYLCHSLTDLDLSHFDTSKVINMSTMFYGCSSLTTLDVSSFDTSKVGDMSLMFSGTIYEKK